MFTFLLLHHLDALAQSFGQGQVGLSRFGGNQTGAVLKFLAVRQTTADSWVHAMCARLKELDSIQPEFDAHTWTTGLQSDMKGIS